MQGSVVLVVDDSASIRKFVKVILEKNGYTVREAGSEVGLFSTIDEYGHLADLILMDINIKNEHGLNLVNKLKESATYRNIPIIMLTLHSDKKNVIGAKVSGVQGYLVKPINPQLLLKRVSTILEETKKTYE